VGETSHATNVIAQPVSRATVLVLTILCAVGCSPDAPHPAALQAEDVLTYPIPPEGLSVKRVVEDAERILGRRISCTECALAESPVKITGLPRARRSEALRLFQAIFVTRWLSLSAPSGMEPSLFLECLDTTGSSIRRGRFVWVDDVVSEPGDAVLNTVILTKHIPVSELREAVTPLFDSRLSRYAELFELRGWVVRAPPATILKMLDVVRALDVPSPDELIYPIPAEGLPVKRVVADAERILGRKIVCSELALAYDKPIRIVGLPRSARSEALRLFQALFLTLRLQLSDSDGMGQALSLDFLASSGLSIRGGGFYWIDDIASQTVEHQIKAVILLRYIRAEDIRDSIIPVFARTDWFNELSAPNGWLVQAPPATILRMLKVVRTLDVAPTDSMPTTRTSR
jgi:hypothetical protein